MTKKELLAARHRVFTRQTELNQLGATENRSLTEAETTEYERLEAEYDRLDGLIARANTIEDEERAETERAERSTGVGAGRREQASGETEDALGYEERSLPNDPEERAVVVRERDNAELRAFLMGGIGGLNENMQRAQMARRAALSLQGRNLPQAVQNAIAEVRAQSTGTDAGGGYIVPEGFFARLNEAKLAYGGVRNSRVTVLTTSTGEQLPMPTVDDTSNTGNLKTENDEVDETDVTFSEKVLNAYTIVSDLVRVPMELQQDSYFDIGGLLARLLGTRIARKESPLHTTGTGSSQPNGVVTASALGKTAASASAITYLEMIDLKFAVDGEYAMNGEWMMNRGSVFKAVKKLLDGDNRPIFQPDVQQGRIDRIDGDQVVINHSMADIAASAKVMLYGDFAEFYIRDVRGTEMLRLRERYAEFLQWGYLAYSRTDSELNNAGTNPIKHYIMAAS